MTSTAATIFIVDDDAAVRDSLALLLSLRGFATQSFDSAESFLAGWHAGRHGCLILDLRMKAMSGLELQAELARRGARLPIIFVTAHGDVAAARAALLAGATDFIEKPIDDDQLDAAIRRALSPGHVAPTAASARTAAGPLLERLTDREREVILLVVDGLHNREIAEALAISARTVETHKARAMAKLQVDRVPDLVRLLGALPGRDGAG